SYDTEEKRAGAERAFWSLKLLPLLHQRDTTLTWFFTQRRPLLRPGERIATDTSGVAALQDDILPKLEAAARLWALGVPYNTIETRLGLGTGPIPGGDVGYLPSSAIPALEAGAPLPAPVALSVKAMAHQKSQRAARALQRVRRDVATRMEPEVAAAFATLAGRVVSRARAAKAATYVNGHGAATVVKELPDAEQLVLADDAALFGGIFRAFTLEVLRASWELWNQALDVELAFDERDPAVVEALAQSGARITGIVETTREAVRGLLQYGAGEGWTIDQLVRGTDERPGLRALVEQTYRGRARTIARTETGEAQQTAAMARYEAAGVGRVLVLDNGQDDPDDACARLNGTVQTLAWARANALGHPNCTRAFAPSFE
ncbi:MAG TPA: hypothetical protein VFX50_12695, partial [Gemmatimonadales bacterium]|nr:hypothetical protein [Gemmatimonadales bacterium]